MNRRFVIAALFGLIWVQVSEIWRYFFFVKPEVIRYFEIMNIEGMSHVDNTIVWALWGSILTAVSLVTYGLFRRQFGRGPRSIAMSTLLVWTNFFVLFWVGSANMGLASWSFLPIPLSLSFIEILILNVIVDRLLKSDSDQEEPSAEPLKAEPV